MAKLGALIPLFILFVVVGVGSFVGYHLYVWSNELTERGKKNMEKKNVAFTREGGLRVGVKEMQNEKYEDKTQNVLVNVWNNASLPNYKSRLGWNRTQADPKKSSSGGGSSSAHKSSPSSTSTSSRPSASRSHSGASSSALAPGRSPAEQRPGAQRTPSTPGAWS